jgi:inorganic pyrophosphatase
VAILDPVDRKNVDSKILAAPATNPSFDQIRSIIDVPPHVREEIEHFFTIYKELEEKEVRTRGGGREGMRWRPS